VVRRRRRRGRALLRPDESGGERGDRGKRWRRGIGTVDSTWLAGAETPVEVDAPVHGGRRWNPLQLHRRRRRRWRSGVFGLPRRAAAARRVRTTTFDIDPTVFPPPIPRASGF
jgi:hypothetical protein